jgi:hypothetical protein
MLCHQKYQAGGLIPGSAYAADFPQRRPYRLVLEALTHFKLFALSILPIAHINANAGRPDLTRRT